MGYSVLRIKNEQIKKFPDIIAERIRQRYFEIIDTKRRSSITPLEKPSLYDPIPVDISNNLIFWALSFNKELNYERWSVDYFKENLTRYHSKLVTNQCAMERLILLLLGLNLRKLKDGSIDFEYSSSLLKKSIDILTKLFEENKMAAIHLKNMYNITAPGFFKNLIFKGGPNINPGIVSINTEAALNSNIHNFNTSFYDIGISVEKSEIKSECNVTLNKFNKNKTANFDWLIKWMNKL